MTETFEQMALLAEIQIYKEWAVSHENRADGYHIELAQEREMLKNKDAALMDAWRELAAEKEHRSKYEDMFLEMLQVEGKLRLELAAAQERIKELEGEKK